MTRNLSEHIKPITLQMQESLIKKSALKSDAKTSFVPKQQELQSLKSLHYRAKHAIFRWFPAATLFGGFGWHWHLIYLNELEMNRANAQQLNIVEIKKRSIL